MEKNNRPISQSEKDRINNAVLIQNGQEPLPTHEEALSEIATRAIIIQPQPATPKNTEPAEEPSNAGKLLSKVFEETDTDNLKVAAASVVKSIFTSCTIDPAKVYEMPEPVLTCDGVAFFTKKNFSQIIGLPKSRKSWFCQLLAGLYLSGGTRPNNPRLSAPADGGGVLYIDTEQGEEMAAKIYHTICRMIDKETEPRLNVLTLREYGSSIRLQVTAEAIDQLQPQLVILDGVADLMANTNDIAESARLQNFLMKFSSIYNCHIAAVIHSNIGDENHKGRGHLGSDMTRKAETTITLTKDTQGGENTNVEFTWTRGKTPDPFSIYITPDLLPAVGEYAPAAEPNGKLNKYNQIVELLKKEQRGYTRKEIVDLILDNFDVRKRTAETYVSEMAERGQLEQNGKLYYISKD